MRQGHWRASGRGCAVDLHRRGAALAGVDHGFAISGELDIVQRARTTDDDAAGPAVRRNHLNSLPPPIFGGEEKPHRVGRPGETLHGTVERIGNALELPTGAVKHHQPPAIALVTRTLLA